jgi:nucleoside-diphosphate-sugar epimerase
MARGLMACALRGDAGEVYNLATGKETTILDLAETINDLTANTAPLDLKPARDWDRSGKRFASTQKAEEKLGFVARMPIDEGLARTIEWTRANQDIIAACMAKHAPLMKQSLAAKL